MNIGFDNQKYLQMQSEHIRQRIAMFGDKLYLEFGGKLFDDYHASRVLPGFEPDSKLKMLLQLKDQAEVVIAISAGSIEANKMRRDSGLTYDLEVIRLIESFEKIGLMVGSVVITQYSGQPAADNFRKKLQNLNIKCYIHYMIEGYPANVERIVSDDGYGRNEYIETTRPLIVVTAPGPGSGKMATCLSQLYHEHKRGIKAGYAKFETFPVWSLPLKHPVNLAYEAATADLGDINMVDSFHLESRGETAVNYNRDIEIFPVVRRICAKIMEPEQLYVSPTDMGVNRLGFAISDDEAVQYAAKQEIIRRHFRAMRNYAEGEVEACVPERIKLLMDELGISENDRAVVAPAREAADAATKNPAKFGNGNVFCGAAIELHDGTIITGKNTPLLHAASSCIINAIKHLAGLPSSLHLLSPQVITSVGQLKHDIFAEKQISLALSETLTALSVSTPSNPAAALAMAQLEKLRGCEMHMSHIPPAGDETGLRKLGINLTSEPVFTSRNLFMEQ